MYPYICVTKSRTISFLISGVSCFPFIAAIIEGRHLLGIVKLEGKFIEDVDVLLVAVLEIDRVVIADWLGETDRTVGKCIGVLASPVCDEDNGTSGGCSAGSSTDIGEIY